MASRLVGYYAVLLLLPCAEVLSSADGIFTCPGFWMDKSTYNRTCEVYTASVDNTTCPGASGELSFSFTPYGGVLQQYCTVSSYFDAGCDKSFNSKGCRCKEKTSNDTYILEYMVTTDVTTHMGGSWSCVPLCVDSNFVPVSKNIIPIGNCANVVIVYTIKYPLLDIWKESIFADGAHLWPLTDGTKQQCVYCHAVTSNSTTITTETRSDYDSLRLKDVEKQSPYAEIQALQQTRTNTGTRTGQSAAPVINDYESLRRKRQIQHHMSSSADMKTLETSSRI